MRSVLFIHQSVGSNLISEGKMYDLSMAITPNFALSDYAQNLDLLHDNISVIPRKMGLTFPGKDTTPAAYAAIFTNTPEPEYKRIQDFALRYDMVVLKSCFPNSNIKSDEQLETIKQQYLSIIQFFTARANKRLIILTTPPLRRLRTSAAAARRARQLATWLSTQNFGPNIGVFNLFDLLANPETEKHANTLYSKYSRSWPFDSHPNAKAAQAIAPLLAQFIAARIPN